MNACTERKMRIRGAVRVLLLVGLFICMFPLSASAAPDSKGTDFWLAFPGNAFCCGTPTLSLFITSDVPTTGEVTIPGLGFSTPFSVTPPAVTTVEIPLGAHLTTSDVVESKGIHVTAGNEVTVYGLNRIPYSTDAYLGLPTDILGTEYIVLGYKNVDIVNGTEFGIVATVDETTVTITPSVTTGPRTVGVPYNISLNQGQTYQLINTGSAPNDLSGTIITSDKPVAVFGGHNCANIPNGTTYACDHIVEQLPPVVAWGKSFVTMPLATRRNGDTFRFLASVDGTSVTVNGTVVATLNRGELHERIITEPAQITSNQPILVAQYSNGTTYDGVTSDPFMMLIPPFEQFLGGYTVATPASGFAINYINVVAPTEAVGAITLDGVAIPASSFVTIGTSGFSGAQVSVSLGSHTLAGPLPFGAFMYGFADADSYGYPGGMSLAPVVRVTRVVLAPKTATNPVGTEHCVTATVTDQDSNPVAGVRVDFNVTGANPTAGFATTDTNGQARFCYTGANPGTDTIVASVGTISDTATKTWVSGPSIAIGLTGCTMCQAGDRFTAQATVNNQSGRTLLVEVKLGVSDPNDDEMALSMLGDRHFEFQMSPGAIGPVTVFDATLPDGLQPGTWKYEGALLDRELGETLARDFKEFTIVLPGDEGGGPAVRAKRAPVGRGVPKLSPYQGKP